ncbi:F-box domain-containing protein [Hirschfeldia incana]|nr:F-box domain-containing protein [Hirschfeldia incana]
MVEISDIPDGADGGAPNKKPQEQPGEVKPATSFESLPDVLIEHIVARIPICNHPAISVLSKLFGRIVASPDLRLTRSKLAISEHVLYALVGFPPHPPSWYILYRSSNNASLRLRRVNALPPMPYGPAVVTIGHEMYVIGGCDVSGRYLASVTVVDCRTHTCRYPPSMGVARLSPAAGVVNGMIYVMGGCDDRSKDWVEVFDLGRQTWHGMGKDLDDVSREFVTCHVVRDKIYALGQGLHVCEPIEVGRLRLSIHQHGSELTCLWQPSSCVVDDMLYTYDPVCWRGHPIIVFDLEEGVEEGVWKPVRGVYGLPPCLHWFAYESRMVNVGGKLVILVGNQSRFWNYYGEKCIWCVEIALERRQGGEIWGRVERAEVVFKTNECTPPTIVLCRTVIV